MSLSRVIDLNTTVNSSKKVQSKTPSPGGQPGAAPNSILRPGCQSLTSPSFCSLPLLRPDLSSQLSVRRCSSCCSCPAAGSHLFINQAKILSAAAAAVQPERPLRGEVKLSPSPIDSASLRLSAASWCKIFQHKAILHTKPPSSSIRIRTRPKYVLGSCCLRPFWPRKTSSPLGPGCHDVGSSIICARD